MPWLTPYFYFIQLRMCAFGAEIVADKRFSVWCMYLFMRYNSMSISSVKYEWIRVCAKIQGIHRDLGAKNENVFWYNFANHNIISIARVVTVKWTVSSPIKHFNQLESRDLSSFDDLLLTSFKHPMLFIHNTIYYPHDWAMTFGFVC